MEQITVKLSKHEAQWAFFPDNSQPFQTNTHVRPTKRLNEILQSINLSTILSHLYLIAIETHSTAYYYHQQQHFWIHANH